MTSQDALHELLARLGANKGASVLVSEKELNDWPESAVRAMRAEKLLVRASPATSVVCPGCEQECVMLVHTLTHDLRRPASFIVCDKRDDINRVPVPTSLLEQWQCSGHAIADLLASLLGLRRPDSGNITAGRWEVGVLKGRRGSSHLLLLAQGTLTLALAGHSIALGDVLELGDNCVNLDRRALLRRVDRPIGSAGDTESAAQRRARLSQCVQAEKDKGTMGFLKAVAQQEGISVSRLKQLIGPKEEPLRPARRRSP